MRKMMFRVWSPKYKTMQEDPFALCSGYCMKDGILRETDGPYGEEYSNETDDILMEWTGLVDMDGEDVYEGDILAFSYGIPPVKVHAPVEHKDGIFRVMTPGHNPESCPLHELEDVIGGFYVDGNIYQHKGKTK